MTFTDWLLLRRLDRAAGWRKVQADCQREAAAWFDLGDPLAARRCHDVARWAADKAADVKV